ncbi:MAG: serine/threonine protein kinase, partial [Myxococcales bacterium]|nr:serine/threonine protein kinase [Myxococcales bacterium]
MAGSQARADEDSAPGHEAEAEPFVEEITEGQVLQREEAARAAAQTGSRVGQMLADRYRLERLIAKGGMGRVYLATQLPLERRVAIKLLVAKAYDEEFRQRFFLEASTCARLVHRHIVTVHDYGEAENGELFMAMEYLDGEPLSKVISHEIRIPSERACQIALQICRALRTAHKAGVVHRDLKPGNIMLLGDEDHEQGDFIKVLDFGLVKAFQKGEESPNADLTRSGTWLGSPRYMAPEQIRCKDVDPRTDIYSLGVILFHMIAGRPPFVGGNSVEILEQHLRDPVPSIRDTVGQIVYAPELEIIIRKCMEKDPGARYQSMDELIPQLKAAFRLSTGVSIHTESSLPMMVPDLVGETGSETSASGRGSNSVLRPVRADTVHSRPPPVPELGPPPDLGLGLADPDLLPIESATPIHDVSVSGMGPDPAFDPSDPPLRRSKKGLLLALAPDLP